MDVDLLFDDAEAEASIFARGKIIIEAEKKFLKWKAIGDASNRRGFGNSRASYYRALQQNENLKSKAMGSKDIRDFFIEEEDTNDEMAHPLIDRQSNKRGKVASSALSMEEALEIALSLAKVTRNKKQEAKSGIMAWEKMRAIAVVEYLKMRLSNIGKMVASAKCTINVYKNGGTKNYKARSVRFWADQLLLTGSFPEYKQGQNIKTNSIVTVEATQIGLSSALREMIDTDRTPLKFQKLLTDPQTRHVT